MKQEFGEDQMEVYAKMKEAQDAANAPPPPEEETGPAYKTKMRMTLKGYVKERVEDTSTTTQEPRPQEAQDQETATKTMTKVETQQDTDLEFMNAFDVFLPGQQAEWNSMMGTRGYDKVDPDEQEQDWQTVNIVEKVIGKDDENTEYVIQRGTMKVDKVKPIQLRKPKRGEKRHDA